MYNPFSLEGKVIFISGASSGIGKAIAVECSKMGASIVISGRNNDRLQETYSILYGKGHLQIIADLMNPQDIHNLANKIPNLDGIVHCAGLIKTIPFQFVKEVDLSAILQVNFIAPTLLSLELLKKKKINKGASIVFISSISGVYCSYAANSIYSASKGAVNGIVKGMAIDLSVKNIRVNSVNPGMINSSLMSEGIITSVQLQEDMKRYPLKRYGKPEEVAFATIYLLSDAAKWVTGSNLLIDGGYSLL